MTVKFSVPLHLMTKFAGALKKTGLDNMITGSEDGNVELAVDWNFQDTGRLDPLVALVKPIGEEIEEDEDEDEDDEDEDDEDEDEE
jgi:hypothetical protein